jgi:hypothetical protein
VLKVFTDFNAITPDGMCWILQCEDSALEERISDLRLNKGDKIVLYQDEDDFEVTATLDFRYVDILKREAWVAIPDWGTLIRK